MTIEKCKITGPTFFGSPPFVLISAHEFVFNTNGREPIFHLSFLIFHFRRLPNFKVSQHHQRHLESSRN